MSDTNRVRLNYVREVTFGVLPTTPTLREMAVNSIGLAFEPETVTSEQIRSDRQIDDLALVGAEASGEIAAELSYGTHDLLLESALFNVWQNRGVWIKNAAATQITAVDGTNNDFEVTNLGVTAAVNDIVRASGFAIAANNGFHIVNGSPTTTSIPVATDLVQETTPPVGARIHIVGRRSAAGDLDLTISGATGTLASTILNLTTVGLEAGDWIKLAGFSATPANNGYYRLGIAPGASLLTFDRVPTGAATENPAGAVDIYFSERLTNGTTRHSYSFEERFQDHSPETFQYFRGMCVDSLEISAESQSIVGLSFDFAGKDALFSDQTNPTTEFAVDGVGRVNAAVDVPLESLQVLNSSSNVGRIARGGTPITGKNFVLEATVEVNNNLRQLNAVGFLGAVNIGVGECSITGNLETYFDDQTLAQSVINNTETAFDMRFQSSIAQSLVIDLPRVKFSAGSPDISGKNQDVTVPLEYQAIRYPTFNYTIKLCRFHGIQ